MHDSDSCRWHCPTCKKCHANACPRLWGGDPEVPCEPARPGTNPPRCSADDGSNR